MQVHALISYPPLPISPCIPATQTPLLLTPTVHQALPCEVNQLLQQLSLPPFAFRIMHRNSVALYLKFLFNRSAGYIVPLHFRHNKGLTPSCFIHHFCPPSSVHQENFQCIFCTGAYFCIITPGMPGHLPDVSSKMFTE